MKKYIIILAAIHAAICVNAQLQEGGNMINANFSFSKAGNNFADTAYFQNSKSNSSSNFSLALSYGHFVRTNKLLGVSFGYQNRNEVNKQYAAKGSANQTSSQASTKGETYNAGIFGRYYKWIYKDKLALFGHLAANYTFVYVNLSGNNSGASQPTSYYHTSEYSNGFGLGIKPGITYFVTKNFAIETMFGSMDYSWLRRKQSVPTGLSTYTTTNFNSSLKLSLSSLVYGVSIYFGGPRQVTTPK